MLAMMAQDGIWVETLDDQQPASQPGHQATSIKQDAKGAPPLEQAVG